MSAAGLRAILEAPPGHEDPRRRLENVRFMAASGESLEGAARRLGLTADTLEKDLARDKHHDLVAQLRSRNPASLYVSKGRTA